MIVTANSWFRMSWDEYRKGVLLRDMTRNGVQYRALDLANPGEVQAFVNRGRWLVKCECGGAEHAWEEGLFMCRSCFNSGHGHCVRKAVFPDKRTEIEKLLDTRPLANRHWFTHETVADLKRENKEHRKELLEVI